VVIFPGLGANVDIWDDFARSTGLKRQSVRIFVAKNFSIDRSINREYPNLADFAADLARQIDSLDLDSVTLIGHSVGVFVMSQAAETLQTELSCRILVNGGLTRFAELIDNPVKGFRDPKMFLLAGAVLVNSIFPVPLVVKRMVANHPRLRRVFLGRYVGADLLESDRKCHDLLVAPGRPWVAIGLWRNRHHWPRFVQSLRSNASPLIFLWGDSDPVATGTDTYKLAAMVGADYETVRVVKGAGHSIPLENPDSIIAVVINHLNPIGNNNA
jgi:pimeloyl-ACP methyl ester carboxylesterase